MSAFSRTALAVLSTLTALSSSALALDNSFSQTILVASDASYNPTAFVDPLLLNAWGLALRPPGAGGHFWTGNAKNSTSSTYIGDVNGTPLYQDALTNVQLDGPLVSFEDGVANVTGLVYNAASDVVGQPVEFFVSGPSHNLTTGAVIPGGTSGSSKFVFVTTDGTINAWRAGTTNSMDSAVIVKDYSLLGAERIPSLPRYPAFTGVGMTTDPFTLGTGGEHIADNRLFVADFANGIIRTYNNQWQEITGSVVFERPADLLPENSPYNVQVIGDRVYVAYAVLDLGADEFAVDDPTPGTGRIVAYDRNGHVVQDFDEGENLTSPWGLAIAPQNWGPFGGDLLVSNFVDGTIAVFDLVDGSYKDVLRDDAGDPLVVDGIWGIAFGNGVSLGDSDSLYFAAGPNTEQDGTFGRVRYNTTAVPEPSTCAFYAVVLGMTCVFLVRRRRTSRQ